MQATAHVSRPRRTTAALAVSLLLFALLPLQQARAFDAITLDSGYGLEDTRLLRLNFSTGDAQRYPAGSHWYWSRIWEGNFSYWYLYKNSEGVEDLFELGLTPNLRLERVQAWDWGHPYLEAGLGVHLLSKVHIGPRDLGTALQFGTHVGFGLSFGEDEQWDVAWRFEHLSNGGIKDPNPGINFAMVRLGYRW